MKNSFFRLLSLLGLFVFPLTVTAAEPALEQTTEFNAAASASNEEIQTGQVDEQKIEPADTGTVAADNSAAIQALVREKEALEELVASLESRQNAYGLELSQAYGDLGAKLRELEDYEAAIDVYGKALQALRVSFGLYDLKQLEVLQALHVAKQQLEKWDEVSDLNHLIYHITKKNPEAGTDLRVRSLLQLGRWNMQAARNGQLEDFFSTAKESARLYNEEISYLEGLESFPGKGLQLASLQLDLAALQLMQAEKTQARPLNEFGTEGRQSDSRVQCYMVRLANGSFTQICETTEIPNMNYYLVPANRKNQEIKGYVDGMKNTLVDVFHSLQDETIPAEQRDALLAEMHRLTEGYNQFMTANSTGRIK